MSTFEDDQRYIDAIAIVEAYERAARSEQSRASALINMDAAVAVMESILDAAETALERMQDQPIENTEETQETEVLNQTNNQQAPKAENSCGPDESEEWVAKHKGGTTFQVGLNKDLSVEDPIRSTLEALGVDMTEDQIRKDLERCFDCDLRPKFDFQIKPVNFLSELMPLLEGIHDLVDQVLETMEPLDVLKWLCDIGDIFKEGWCLPDLLALLLAWNHLLQKYFGQMLRIALNWTFIVGPIIKFLVDTVATLMEQIRRIIIAPIDCAASVLGQLITIENAINESVDSTAAFADTFPKFWDQKFGKNYSQSYQGVKPKKDEEKGSLLKRATNSDPKSVGLPTGLTFSMSDTLESIFNKNLKERAIKRREDKVREYWVNNQDAFGGDKDRLTENQIQRMNREANSFANKPSFLEAALAGTNSAKRAINELFANILLAVKSLNAFVVGTLGLSVKLSGFILMVLDLIKFIVFIINTLNSGLSLKDLCGKLKNDPEYAKELMNSWFFHEDGDNISKDREEWQKIMEEFKKPPSEDCTPT